MKGELTEGRSASPAEAVALHQAGKITEAATMYETLLRSEPANADLWGLLSIAQMQLDKSHEAMASWRKCLSLDVPTHVRLRNIVKVLMALRQKGMTAGPLARFLDGVDIPPWPKTLLLDRSNQAVVVALARCLTDWGRAEMALPLLESVLARPANDPEFLVALAPLTIAAGIPRKLLEALRPLTYGSQRSNGRLLIVHAAAATAANLREEAERASRQACEAVPVFLSAEKPGQRLLIGVLNSAPTFIRDVYSPAHLHFYQNTPAILHSKMNDEFRFLSVFPEAEAANEALRALPRPRLVINNWVNPERLCAEAGKLDFIAGHAESLGLPILNHPRRASLTTRLHNAHCLADIDNLVVPRVMLFRNEPAKLQGLVERIGEEFGFPVIIRNPFGQKGAETEKPGSPAELQSYLAKVAGQQLYAIEYVHNPRALGGFRKIRLAVIGAERFMLNIYYGTQWNVHRAPPDMTEADAAFAYKALRRPEEALGAAAMTALNQIADRTPLDIYGVDFDLLPDGRILFFEANASMSLHMREKEDPPETLLGMRNAYRRLFENPPRHLDRTAEIDRRTAVLWQA